MKTSSDFEVVPAFVPMFIILRYYPVLGDKVFKLLLNGYLALTDALREGIVKLLLLSLADFRSKIHHIRTMVSNILLLAREYGAKIIMDCGGLEVSMIKSAKMPLDSYFYCKNDLEDPLKNLERQLEIRPDVLTLLDDLGTIPSFSKVVEKEDKIMCIIARARTIKRVKISVVIHKQDRSLIDEFLSSQLVKLLNYIAIPERELEGNQIYELARELHDKFQRPLMIYGLSNMSLVHVNKLREIGAIMGDTTLWLIGEFKWSEDGIFCEKFHETREGARQDIQKALYNNLKLLRKAFKSR